VNPFGSHSLPLAALVTRGSKPDILLTPKSENSSPLQNIPPLGAAILLSLA
jgi:hypothetical protein